MGEPARHISRTRRKRSEAAAERSFTTPVYPKYVALDTSTWIKPIADAEQTPVAWIGAKLNQTNAASSPTLCLLAGYPETATNKGSTTPIQLTISAALAAF